MTRQQYIGRFVLPIGALDFAIDDGTAYPLSLAAGARYAFGYNGEVDVQFLEHVQEVIRSADAAFIAATVTFDPGGGRVTIDFGVGTTVTWTDTPLRDILGFNGNLTGSDTYTAENQMRYVWLPSSGLSDYPGDLTEWWARESSTKGTRSKDGFTSTVKGSELFGGSFEYDKLPKKNVIKSSTTTWQSFENFFTDVIHEGQPFRCYPDRALDAEDSFKTAVWAVGDEDEGVGSFAELRKRNIDSFNGHWIVELELWKFVE